MQPSLPTITEIERVWYEIMREMKATGEVVKFNTRGNDKNVDGTSVDCEFVRVGVYNAVCGNKYLEYVPTKGQYQFLANSQQTDIQAQLEEYLMLMLQVDM